MFFGLLPGSISKTDSVVLFYYPREFHLEKLLEGTIFWNKKLL